MFPGDIAERFTREHGCTTAEWQRDLPGAVAGHGLQFDPSGHARVGLAGGGTLTLRWQALPPRQIALMRMPRLHVDYVFDGVDAAARSAFMKRFDLVLQRGGG